MIVLGLTGSIAMGKSTIANFAKYQHIPVLDLDKLAKTLIANSTQVKDCFPECLENGQLSSSKLAQVVFSNTSKLNLLEKITYPALTDLIINKIKQYRRNYIKLIIIDAPKLFEARLHNLCDYVICVNAPQFLQIQRIYKRKKYDDLQIKQILANQISNVKKMQMSDFIIQTGNGKSHSLQTLIQILKQLNNA
ncbi:dephospho-CoA kinase [Rickettsiales endosymbiont of Stachyamoeba lipophora]|uniref:dephospho-CoA kinase n=1 Tax=Rickettsiales endosymbiont of Stachyamoeba lipophora TaxID=2486578 RepID=UPI000F64E338|nr:dephospho-CoA kinase [Rickettsiales endosymbiont of Stachyamoeba lipophora]AZL15691.1 dephospho-CoA kinase [Rickettsiales endosymbiont of Stachyamoeba lipophora]